MSILIKPESTDLAKRNARIARGFSLAAGSYDDYADVQENIANTALSLIKQTRYVHALDIGCGTGRHTSHLKGFSKQVTGIDLAAGMVAHAQQRYPEITFIEGMAEKLPVGSNSVDLVFSSMALQWCLSPLQVLKEIFKVMTANGCASLAIMVDGSFAELAHARKLAGQPRANNPLLPASMWCEAAQSAGFRTMRTSIKEYCVYFRHILPLLQSIKHVGAGTLVDGTSANQFKFSRRDLNRLNLAYQKETTADGSLPLTYRVCHLTLEK
ncbi:methyltransferase domain-containing protein [Alteromonas ponticola]|uniref:Methyltransferase domain-containing protein n=1 Tax=Alteromonas aquimaris TaxID=2998417 RepID=A0ABT3P5S1_9ALTE|nr:methyltransferase domain-containing protein [Alteromonas aquimaris]MCW8107880.1 methyltransferase domain-containing protein [Alteromonas aquimaris]